LILQSALDDVELALDPEHTIGGVTKKLKGITYLATRDWNGETDHGIVNFCETIGRSAAARE